MSASLLQALQLLLRSSHLATPDELPQLTAAAARHLGATNAMVYLIDYEQVSLVPFLAPGDETTAEAVTVEGTLAGRAFADVALQMTDNEEGRTVWTPLLDGTARLGVVQFLLPPSIDATEELLQACRDLTALLAELVMTRTFYGDSLEQVRRRSGLTVPAEMQWRMLPPLTFVSRTVGIAGVLLPAEEIAGDTFDYALNGDTAHVAIFDAMGHGLEAGLLASVAIATLRNARRNGIDLLGSVEALDATIGGEFGPDKFVTGIVAELNVVTGWWEWITCGHPPALVVRGGRVVKTLDSVIGPPVGLGLLAKEPEVGRERLERGDRLLLYSDGVVEARDDSGEFFGVDRLVEFLTREVAAGRPIAETLRRLNRAIMEHQSGKMHDDATTVVVEWLTDEPDRNTPS